MGQGGEGSLGGSQEPWVPITHANVMSDLLPVRGLDWTALWEAEARRGGGGQVTPSLRGVRRVRACALGPEAWVWIPAQHLLALL